MDEIDLLLGFQSDVGSPPAAVPPKIAAKRLFSADARAPAPPKRAPIEKVVVKQSGRVADLSSITPRKVHVIETAYVNSPTFAERSGSPRGDSKSESTSSVFSVGGQTPTNRLSRCGRKSTANTVIVSLSDLHDYHHQLIPLEHLRPEQTVPEGFVGTEIPVCRHCGKVTVGKLCAYQKHRSTCNAYKQFISKGGEQASGAQLTNTSEKEIVYNFVLSGCSVRCAHHWATGGRYPGFEGMPQTLFYNKIWNGVRALSHNMMVELAKLLRNEKLIVAIDAGSSALTDQHMLVAVVYWRGRGFLLPPAYQGAAFTASALKSALTAILSSIGATFSDIKFWIADGCRTNRAFFDILDEEDAYVRQALSDLSDHPPKTSQFKEFARENSDTGDHIYCRGHWINVILSAASKEVWKKSYPFATELLQRFNQCLFNAPTRARRVKEFVTDFNEKSNSQTHSTKTELQKLIKCSPLYDSLVALINKAKTLVDVPEEQTRSKKGLVEFLQRTLAEMPDIVVSKKTTPIKLGNTRWMANRYQAIEFLHANFDAIRLFVAVEFDTYPCASIKEMKESLYMVAPPQEPSYADCAREELSSLLDVMEPIANYLTLFSEESPYKALIVHQETSRMYDALDEIPKNAYVNFLLEQIISYRRDTRNDDLWSFARWIAPGAVGTLVQCSEAPTPHLIRKICRVTVQEDEWRSYLRHCINTQASSDLPMTTEGPAVHVFWQQHGLRWQSVYELATLILNIPVVVTGCDSVFSAEAWLFDNRRTNTNVDSGAAQLCLRHNLRKWERITAERLQSVAQM